MLKVSSKRRRTLNQIKLEKEAAAQKEADTQAKLAMVEELQQQVMALQQEHETGKVASNLMSQFINAGVVEHGEGNEFTIKASPSASKFKPFQGE
jgi:flagellar biosynthesis GTPase FlhF